MKKKILINVEPTYLEEHSDPFEDSYLWAYKVIIKNNSEQTVKLISRHWKIFDSNGSYREVKGKRCCRRATLFSSQVKNLNILVGHLLKQLQV